MESIDSFDKETAPRKVIIGYENARPSFDFYYY